MWCTTKSSYTVTANTLLKYAGKTFDDHQKPKRNLRTTNADDSIVDGIAFFISLGKQVEENNKNTHADIHFTIVYLIQLE
jgi:hypothetical protein